MTRTRLGDLTVVGHVRGPAAPDRAVVLVHGVGSSARAYRRLGEHLATRAAVHAVDLPGYGASPRPRHDVDIAAHAAALARYISDHVADAGLPAPVVVGHSMGAQVVGQLLADHPDAAGAAVLVGPTAEPGTRTIARQALRLAADAAGEPPATVGVLLVDAFVRCSVPYYLGQLRHVVDHRLERVLPRARVPVVVVRGEHDPVAPPDWVAALAACAPDGRYRTVRGRHHAMDSDPAGVAGIVLDAGRTAGRGTP
ncbi:alpha/beta fold hydrolase [Promicromonospora thailandica]|uniref:Alpha/beta hydrolase family protein n=1 Tax=Promicromonospora thailandica TaxID=765201 RepID=A0A9X2GD20_9MICO|nr:alpha/beta hydrolase family protein [Promicromonospora thailandica]MCP2266996.1 Alpha/beta hydrolase family protein [Promicromonospora thailandica]